MKRILLAAALAVLAAAGESQAAGRGPGAVASSTATHGGCASCGQGDGGARFGLNPFFRAGSAKRAGVCSTCAGRGAYGYGGGPGGPGGPGMDGAGGQPGGTLVFPNHWYTRSPRDFFMWERR